MNKYFFLLLVLLASCTQKKKSSETETATYTRYTGYKGTLNISADEGLKTILEQQKEIFEFHYDSVRVNISYRNEKEIFDDFRSKKSNLMLLARPLIKAEINNFKVLDTIYVEELPVAYDAVALIGNKDFNDKNLDVELLKKYFSPQNNSDSLRLVFENQNSSVVRFVLDYLGYKEKVSSNVFAMKTSDEVIAYVSENKNAIGFIPFNIISDEDEPRVKELFKKIKILSLRLKTKEENDTRASANQSDIVTGDYPLIRAVNTVTRYSHDDDLESLFINFLYKGKGAKIFLKAGLIPVLMPERDIIVNESEVRDDK